MLRRYCWQRRLLFGPQIPSGFTFSFSCIRVIWAGVMPITVSHCHRLRHHNFFLLRNTIEATTEKGIISQVRLCALWSRGSAYKESNRAAPPRHRANPSNLSLWKRCCQFSRSFAVWYIFVLLRFKGRGAQLQVEVLHRTYD